MNKKKIQIHNSQSLEGCCKLKQIQLQVILEPGNVLASVVISVVTHVYFIHHYSDNYHNGQM